MNSFLILDKYSHESSESVILYKEGEIFLFLEKSAILRLRRQAIPAKQTNPSPQEAGDHPERSCKHMGNHKKTKSSRLSGHCHDVPALCHYTDKTPKTDTVSYSFKNWKNSKGGTIGGSTLDEKSVNKIFETYSGGTVALTAQWNGASYTVTESDSKSGKFFMGWSETNGASSATYNVGSTITLNKKDTNLYPVFKKTIRIFNVQTADFIPRTHSVIVQN